MSQEELNRINKALYNASHGLDKFGHDSPQGRYFQAEIEALKIQKANLPPEILRQEKINNLKRMLSDAIRWYLYHPDIDTAPIATHTRALQDMGISDDEIATIKATARQNILAKAQDNTLKILKTRLEASMRDHYKATQTPLQVSVQAVIDQQSDAPPNIQTIIHKAIELELDSNTIQAHINDTLFLSDADKQRYLDQLREYVKAYIEFIEFKASIDPSHRIPSDMVSEIAEWESTQSDEPRPNQQLQILRTKRNLEIYGVPSKDIHQAIHMGQGT